MAPEGHTWPHKVHRYSQYPILGIRRGDQIPSKPASRKAGCSPFVIQTFIHSPHFTHLFRNSFSSSAPGGLSNPGSEKCVPTKGVDLIIGTAMNPESIERITCLLPRSITGTVFAPKPKRTELFGQTSSQVKQAKHSVFLHSCFSPASAPP